MLTDFEVVAIVRAHVESKFPKVCVACGRRYASLADYLLRTTHLGDPVSADAPAAAQPASLIGTISYANCPCGSTLAISSAGMDLLTIWRLLQWAGGAMHRRKISMGALLGDLRRRIDEQVLREHEIAKTAPVTLPRLEDPSEEPGLPLTASLPDR